ncbi:hypothetical protein M3Y98_00194300 [Aphelenchoides besseyi]|nr:hypothetical protein M3Y98_00194300 [Aphelenchoides besseyi]KAI6200240.1 hypothetical protein M3Y96_00712200 [Aphelenchoides besseyi]
MRKSILCLLNCQFLFLGFVNGVIPWDIFPRDVGNLICYKSSHSDTNQIHSIVDIAICERDVRFCAKVLRTKLSMDDSTGSREDVEDSKMTCYQAKQYCSKDGINENEFYVLECCSVNFCN